MPFKLIKTGTPLSVVVTGGSSGVESTPIAEYALNLGPGADWVSGAFSLEGYDSVVVTLFADRDCTYRFEQSQDAGVTWGARSEDTYVASDLTEGKIFAVLAGHGRIYVRNDGLMATTVLRFAARRKL